jgi:hypothetical protein
VLRPDGSFFAGPGYDESTQLFVVDDPSLRLPNVPENPSLSEAKAALKLLKDLLTGFKFDSDVDRGVALSLMITMAARGSMPTAPLHLVRACCAGTGKSFLVDIAAAIQTGRICPVITAGRTLEETEKRLGALLFEGVPIIALDNCSYDLEDDMLCQISERPLVRVRILGFSRTPEFECKATAVATGNNIGPKGDMNRRTLTCNLVADVERPELREFAFNPLAQVLADRGTYLGAVFTIIRAYIAAGSPTVCKPLGSYERWTAMVRAPLIWLGEADPIKSIEATRQEDPELSAIREFFAQWQQHCGNGSFTPLDISRIVGELNHNQSLKHPEFRDLLLRLAGERGEVSTRKLGAWLRRIQGRIVDDLRLKSLPGNSSSRAGRFFLEALEENLGRASPS